MAPRRSGGGSDSSGGGGGGGIQLEDTMQLYLLEKLRSTYTASAIITGILAASFLIIFITSLIIHKRNWKKSGALETSFVSLTITAALFWFLFHVLQVTSYACTLSEAVVFESWVLLFPFQSTFGLIAELTLFAAMLSILHNRVRTVAARMLAKVPFMNWFLFAVYVVLGLVTLGDTWAYSVLQLKELKESYNYYGSTELTFEKFAESPFHIIHARRIGASMQVYRFIIQLVLAVEGIIVLAKMSKGSVSDQGRKATVVFVAGALIPFIVVPLTALIINFKYWDLTLNYPLWLPPTTQGIEGFMGVITMTSLCIFTKMISPVRAPGQWDLGTRKYAGAAFTANVQYYDSPATADLVNMPSTGASTSYVGASYTGAPYAGEPYSGTSYAGTSYADTSYIGGGHGGGGRTQAY